MNDVLKTTPAVFVVGNEYQIMVPVKAECLMWVKVGEENFYNESNGVIRSKTEVHRMRVPAEILDKAGKYTVCYRKIIERKAYFTESEDEVQIDFDFYPVKGEKTVAYQIADAHDTTDTPIAATKKFIEEYGKIDLLILNGDNPKDCGKIESLDTIYLLAEGITKGNIPVICIRGNHDTRGVFAEKIADCTPSENGNCFFTVKVGDIFGVVLDCGEDKDDSHPEYGHTVCCHSFRERETKYLEEILETKKDEYNAENINHKLAFCHVPFTGKREEPFNIEEDIYSYWSKLLKEKFEAEAMLCGHTHRQAVYYPGDETDALGHPCPVVTSSKVVFDEKIYAEYYAGAGFIFEKGKITVIFNDSEKILEERVL